MHVGIACLHLACLDGLSDFDFACWDIMSDFLGL